MILLSQHVDTFKEAFYLNGDFDKYNSFVMDMITLKEQAQEIHDINNDNRFVSFTMSGKKWQVMATSIKGYSVVLKSGDVSMAFKKKGNVLSDRNPSVKVEYRAHFLVNHGLIEAHKIVNDYFKANIHPDYLSKVQEIHMASDTQGHNFNLFDIYRFKTRSRRVSAHDGDDEILSRQMIFTSRRMETIYFGLGSNMLRIYNKSNEIKKHPDSGHIENLWMQNPDYKKFHDVWRVEFQMRREILKTIFTDDKLPYDYTHVLLENLSGLWSFFINYFSYRDISEDTAINLIKGYWIKKDGTPKIYTKRAEREIFSKSLINPFWSMISHFQNSIPPYWFRFNQVKASSPLYAMNAASACISTITKHYGRCTPELVDAVFLLADDRSRNNKDMGLVEASKKKLDDFFSKVEYQKSIGLDVIDLNNCSVKNDDEDIRDFSSNVMYPLTEPYRHSIPF